MFPKMKLLEWAGLAICTTCIAFFCLLILGNMYYQAKRPIYPRVLSATHSER